MNGRWIRCLAGWGRRPQKSRGGPPGQAQSVHYSGSVQYATGSYIFAVRTHSVYFFNGLAVEHARFQASASLPVIYQTSPWISYGGLGALPSGGPQHGTVGGRRPGGGHGAGPAGRRDRIALPDTATYADLGIGDPSLRMDVTLLHGGAGPALRLVGSVTPPPWRTSIAASAPARGTAA